MVTFDPINRLIIVDFGVTEINVKSLYSTWKRWLQENDNSKYLPAFRTVGGDATVGQNSITPYFFLINNWKVRPYEGNHTLVIDGILITDDNSDPYVDTIGNWRISIQSIVPLYAESIEVNTTGNSFGVQEVWEYTNRTLTSSSGISQTTENHILSLTNYDDTIVQSKLDNIQADLNILKDVELGNWKIVGNQMIFYEIGGTELARYNLFDDTGTPSAEAVFERQKV